MTSGIDFYNLDSLLTDEERLVRDAVRAFVARDVLPVIDAAAREGRFPRELLPTMADLGLFGPTLPVEYGGGGAGAVVYGLMMRELERGDSGLRSFASVQSSLVMWPIHTFGSEEQRRRWLPALGRAEAVGCFGLTEPDHGSDPGGMETRAVRDGDGFVLNGAKMWITNGSIADVALVWAKLDGEVRGFLVERGTPGFSAPEMKGKHSLRASVTSELVLQDCRVASSALLPEAVGLRAPLSCLTQARYGIAWGAVGAADACFAVASDYARTRRQFDRPIGSFQLVQEKLAWMLTEITKAQLVALQLGRLKEAGTSTAAQVSLAKRNNVDIALTTARMARDILGANGILDEYPVMRHMNNLESVRTYEGTHDIHTLVLGQAVTGIPAFAP